MRLEISRQQTPCFFSQLHSRIKGVCVCVCDERGRRGNLNGEEILGREDKTERITEYTEDFFPPSSRHESRRGLFGRRRGPARDAGGCTE